MKLATRRYLTLGAIVLTLVLSAAFIACGGGSETSGVTDDDAGDAAHVEGDEHDANTDDHEADEAAHDEGDATLVEGDEHEADGAADANAYLEAAPKDVLYLIEMTNFAFTPEVLEVGVGEVLEIAIQNVEAVLHDFTIDKIDADVHISYLGGTGQHAHAEPELDADVHFALTEPGSGVVHIKVHEPGEYVIYCSVPGHREAGMEGTLIVR